MNLCKGGGGGGLPPPFLIVYYCSHNHPKETNFHSAIFNSGMKLQIFFLKGMQMNLNKVIFFNNFLKTPSYFSVAPVEKGILVHEIWH